jgi:hypothetical protein
MDETYSTHGEDAILNRNSTAQPRRTWVENVNIYLNTSRP